MWILKSKINELSNALTDRWIKLKEKPLVDEYLMDIKFGHKSKVM